jgi:signal transduction histidine kinase
MIEAIAFQTRARTIDHLGREQIADCPTAVSELWKNAYDAYARNVALNIYDGHPAIATIIDDGHGMNRDEFTSRWLVVGTESKAGPSETSVEDKDGIATRTKQGQKGIGRLSSANLGSLLLVVSKRRNDRFIAALIDWRLFENPYLFLMDVEVPIVEFDEKEELLPLLPDLFDRLMGNLWGSRHPDKKDARDGRIQSAWERFDLLELAEGKQATTKSAIEATLIETIFEERHLADWPIWKGNANCGTILAMSDLQFDLQAQLSKQDPKNDSAVTQAREQLFQTLSNFADPFLDEKEREAGYGAADFLTRATIWEGNLRRNLVEEGFPFDLQAFNDLEHVVDGQVDEGGCFRGRIKAFGAWLDDEIVIQPAIDIPLRKDSVVGPFPLRIGTFEQTLETTSHSDEAFRKLETQAEKYSGFLIYRNGLRVMPYGREGSDFFRIEYRKSKHAGREFWSLRQLFGRVALRIESNPNLRDKAGREVLIDNRAAKTLRDLVENILKTTARNYFGSDADLRKRIIPDRKEEYKKKKAEEARNKQRALNRKLFRTNLDRNEPILAALIDDVANLAEGIRTSSLSQEDEVIELRNKLQDARQRFTETSLGEPPRSLGLLEERYLCYRKDSRRIKELLEVITQSLDTALERIKPRSAREIASSVLSSNAAFLHRRLRVWAQESKGLLTSEQERIMSLHNERNKIYHSKMLPLIDQVENGGIPLRKLVEELENERNIQDTENADIFEPYISALNSLKESVDLAGLAHFSQDKADELREEVDRLHSLAQLGITVEIISHEVEGLEQTITNNLKLLPDFIQKSDAYLAVRDGHETLVERLRFLSPLKLSGPRTRINLTGSMIFEYVQRFFRSEFAGNDIKLEATPEFINFSVYEQPARIYPVFINLVNNAAYWVNHSDSKEKRILLDAINEKIVVSDSGPGVDEEDLKHLFRLFFTRKIRGGRGVGLYLCRTNLAAGGHTIGYASDQPRKLPGANFILDFKGAKYA